MIDSGALEKLQAEADALVAEQARAVIDAPWPAADEVGRGVLAGEPARTHVEALETRIRTTGIPPLPALDPGPAFDPKGRTFLEAV